MAEPKRKLVDPALEAAREVLADCDYDRHAAVEALIERLRDDDDLFRLALDPYVPSIAHELLKRLISQSRAGPQQQRKAPTGGPSGSSLDRLAERVDLLARANLAMFLLPDGRPLGKASRPDIHEAVAVYSRPLRTVLTRRAFLVKVAERLPDDDALVEHVLNNDALDAIFADAEREVGDNA